MTISATRPWLGPQWEILDLADGSIELNDVFGRHLRIRRPPPWLRTALREMDGTRTLEELHGPTAELATVVEQLTAAGALRPAPVVATRSIPPELHARFHTFVDYLSRYADESCSQYDLFARIRAAHVCVIGVGGAGSIASMILAAAGIGRLTLVDGDTVELQNLVRQPLYCERDVGRPKVEAIAERLRAFTSFTEISPVHRFVRQPSDLGEVVPDCDFLLLCADAPRFLIQRWTNRFCIERSLPWINALSGMVGPLCLPGSGACFGCLEEHFRSKLGPLHDQIVDALQRDRGRPYPSGVDGYLLIGRIQARECLAVISGAFAPQTIDGIRTFDEWGMPGFEAVPRHPSCRECGDRPAANETAAYHVH